jgi:hypothetical protein
VERATADRNSGASVSVLGWGVVPDDVSYRVSMRVVGEERVSVPAGTFDCWLLVISARGRVLDYWVRKSDGVAVRSHDVVPRPGRDGTSGMREMVLVRE